MHTDPLSDEAALRQRLQAHAAVAVDLACTSTQALAGLVREGAPGQAGTGGTSGLMEVAGRQVFVKLVPLAALELEPANERSTANLFKLPTYYQYGIGSVGFGAWRELALHEMATQWVTSGAMPNFPLLHHWRVLHGLSFPAATEHVGYFDGEDPLPPGAAEVQARIAATQQPQAHLALFLECFPQNLKQWLMQRVAEGGAAAGAAIELVEQQLECLLGFLAAQGVVHFDAHLDNMLTDGRRVVLSDFGLASCERFELDPQERLFLAAHGSYDRCRSAMALVQAIVTAHAGSAAVAPFLRGEPLPGADALPTPVRAVLDRHTPVVRRMRDFVIQLRDESKLTPYPAQELQAAVDQAAGGALSAVQP